MIFDLKCTACGRVIEMHCCNSCGSALELQTPGEATLPRIEERAPDGSLIVLHQPQRVKVDLVGAVETILAEAFQRADRAVSIEVERGGYPPGVALAVLHQVADSLSDGAAGFRERLTPHFTEAAAKAQAR